MKRTRFFLGLLLVGCAPHRATTSSTVSSATAASLAQPVVGDSIPLALRWYRASAEVTGIFLQTYRAATSAVEQMALTQGAQPWGVIMDADETVLDNSMYQQMRGGRGYSSATWQAWVKSEKAVALPGSIEFVRRVHALGGTVSIVTNRESTVCIETEQNLKSVGLNVDQVLCKPAGPNDDKNPRFDAVKSGVGPSKLSAMRVVMWLGDNIKDFPGASQQVRKGGVSAYAEVGKTWFVLPNPLYGSWDKNPVP